MLDEAKRPYPVGLSVERQWEFARVHVVLRLVAAVVLYTVVPAVLGALIVLGPIVTAVLAHHAGGERFHARYRANYGHMLQFLTGINAYMFVVTDSFPEWGVTGPAKVEVQPSGQPTIGSALVRIVTVIPQVVALVALGAIAVVASLLAMIMVLLDHTVPDVLWRYQVGFVTWFARVFAYLYSMVEEYPPFAFEMPPPEPPRR
jgi:hypothetical protein